MPNHYGKRNGCFRCAVHDEPCDGCVSREAEELAAARRPRARPKKRSMTDVIEETNLAARSSFFNAVYDLNLATVEEMLQKKVRVSARSTKEEYLLQDLNAETSYRHRHFGGIEKRSPSVIIYSIAVCWNPQHPNSVQMLKLLFDALVMRGTSVVVPAGKPLDTDVNDGTQKWDLCSKLWHIMDRTKKVYNRPFAELACSFGSIPPPFTAVADDDEDTVAVGDEGKDDDVFEYELDSTSTVTEYRKTVGQIIRNRIDIWNRRKDLFLLSEMC